MSKILGRSIDILIHHCFRFQSSFAVFVSIQSRYHPNLSHIWFKLSFRHGVRYQQDGVNQFVEWVKQHNFHKYFTVDSNDLIIYLLTSALGLSTSPISTPDFTFLYNILLVSSLLDILSSIRYAQIIVICLHWWLIVSNTNEVINNSINEYIVKSWNSDINSQIVIARFYGRCEATCKLFVCSVSALDAV